MNLNLLAQYIQKKSDLKIPLQKSSPTEQVQNEKIVHHISLDQSVKHGMRRRTKMKQKETNQRTAKSQEKAVLGRLLAMPTAAEKV